MKYNAPYGAPNANDPYINGNPSTGTMGSIPPAASIEFPQREIVAMIADAGLTPDNAVLDQLAKAIQSCHVNYANDAGTVNNLQVTLAPVPAYTEGLIVRVRVGQNNTGPSVINCNALGARPIRRKGNAPLLANDLQAGSIATLVYNAVWSVFELVGVGGAGARGELVANKDLYVNYAIGNDANDGTANDAAHALKTIQQAINYAFYYAPSQYAIIIHIADSLLYQGFVTPAYAGPNIIMIGNEAVPANVLVTGQNTHACFLNGPNTMTISGLKATTTVGAAGPGGAFVATNSANMRTHHTANGYVMGAVFEAFGATLNVGSPHTLAGDCGEVFWAMVNGFIAPDSLAAFVIGQSFTVSVAFCLALQGGSYAQSGAPTYSMGGFTVTGKRYNAELNGTINTQGAGVNYFPGSIAGTLATGGQYA